LNAVTRWTSAEPLFGPREIRTDHPLIEPLRPLTEVPESATAFRALADHVGTIVEMARAAAVELGVFHPVTPLARIIEELWHVRAVCSSVATVAESNAQPQSREVQ